MSLIGTLLLTHSSRGTNLDRCSRDFLEGRFASPGRLQNRPPFDSLPSARSLYSGALSTFAVERESDGRWRCRPAGVVKRRRKIQHAQALDGDRLLVGFEHHLEVWNRSRCTAEWEHPHLAGLHTVAALGEERVALSCAAADAVLVFNLLDGQVERTLQFPDEMYGSGYRLTEDRDLREHYIDDDWQAAHVNSAVPYGGRHLLVTSFIPGAVGAFDLDDGSYEEICRGYVGCHGARCDAAGDVYFCDSPSGDLVHLSAEGEARRRFATGSRWLHDAIQVEGDVYAMALSDTNELRLVDIEAGTTLWKRQFPTWPFEGLFPIARRLTSWLGNSTQSLSFRHCNSASSP